MCFSLGIKGIALPTATTVFYLLGNGDGTFSLTELPNPNGWNFGTPPSANYTPLSGDFNADGKVDFGFAAATQFYMFLSTNSPPNFLLSSVTNGLGATSTFTYQPLTNGSVYTKGGGSFPPGLPNPLVYPYADVLAPIYVVSRVDNSNGIGGTLSAAYTYAGARTDNSGRGFLGFRQVTATDLQTNIVKTTTYGQNYPYVGLVASETQSLGGATLNTTTNTYGSTALGGTRYQVFLSQSEASSTDLDGSALPTVTTSYQYDNFGNATQVVASASDGHSKTTDNNYTNDTTSWLLGRLTSATVTSVAPAPPTPPPPVQALQADMTIALVHSGSFQTGQIGAVYTITVGNAGTGPSAGTVTVTDTLPPGLTATAMTGTGWSCTVATLACTRSDPLAAGSSYPPVTLTVNVASVVTSPSVTNIATVSGGGEANSGNNTANDPTTIVQVVNVTISSSVNNLNLWNYLTANGLISSGPMAINVTIAGGVVIGSTSTTVSAFDTGSGTLPPGSEVNITNNGTIIGRGGDGGIGGSCATSSASGSGAAGGPALQARFPVTLANNGHIWGGGGGGGGGGALTVLTDSGYFQAYIMGGGGGGGNGFGSGGAGGTYPGVASAGAGSAGTGTAGGAGGAGADNAGGYYASIYNGSGGPGGGPGLAGVNGNNPGAAGLPDCFGPGAGGPAGAAVLGNSFISWSPTGDVLGPVN